MKKWLTLLAAVPLAVLLGDQLLARAAAEPDRVTADLSVRQGQGAETGERIDWAPERRYRLARERTTRGWRTSITMAGDTTSSGDIVGVVDGGDDEPLQLVDRKGHTRPMPTAADIGGLLKYLPRPKGAPTESFTRQLGLEPPTRPGVRPARQRNEGADWLRSMVSSAADREKRGRVLRTTLGQSRGRVRGLDQYIVSDGDTRREVLVDPVQAVPMEVNVGTGATLASRTLLTYQADVQGNLYRTGMRTERVFTGGEKPSRAITDVRVSNIRLPKGGVR
jgi:hypothetical protein